MRGKAEQFGVKEIYIDDLREEFVRDYVFPMFRCGLGISGQTSSIQARRRACHEFPNPMMVFHRLLHRLWCT